MTDAKIINDPVFGFIRIPPGLLLSVVQHPLMQRLRRINQLGLTSTVYPGAQHTRFQHSIGAFHLMSEAVMSLRQKGVFIFDSEAEAVQAAILMHDIGHGPFSHVLEHTLISGINHEEISLLMMERINRDLNGELTLAIKIFNDQYPKHFLHQLISSQLDMDRLDYLRRDCFFTGVTEGNIGSARIIKMLNVVDDRLVVESKGIYSIENFLTSRRLMYWQVYLHKTTVGAERMLINTLTRAHHLVSQGADIFASPALLYFLRRKTDRKLFLEDPEALHHYCLLDDSDIISALKVWAEHSDAILSTLASSLLERRTFKVEVSRYPFPDDYTDAILHHLADHHRLSTDDARYFMSVSSAGSDLYEPGDDQIAILYKDGSVRDIADVSDILATAHVPTTRKHYLCYLKD